MRVAPQDDRAIPETSVRFDDMLATVLAHPIRDSAARAAAWRQLVDLIAQRRLDHAADSRDVAYQMLREWRADVPVDQRRGVGASLARHTPPADLVAYFAEDGAAVAAPLIATVSLPDDAWLELIPLFSPTARGLLRHRRDLTPAVTRALASFGSADFTIAAPETGSETPVVAVPEDVPPAESTPLHHPPRIADLVARIEAFRRDRVPFAAPPAPVGSTQSGDEAFRFETAWDGSIVWSDAAQRGAIIGLSLAAAAESREHGVDGHAAGAFRRRAPFRDARLTIGGAGALSGAWRISGVPFFDSGNGRFTGYRCTARRPRVDEQAEPASTGLYGSNMPAESLRQLVHEIRTPLGAIIGFAEMIDRQILGPAAADYRSRAAAILAEAQRLLGAVDDLDTAAKLDARALPLEPRRVDGAALLRDLCADMAPLAQERAIHLAPQIADDLPAIEADPVSVERMFSRLLSSSIGLASEGENVPVTLDVDPLDPHRLRFEIGRTRAIAGRDERALLDPGYSPDGDWPEAPVLGLGFALRLVRNLADAVGGRLSIEEDRFVLNLPGPAASAAGIEEQR